MSYGTRYARGRRYAYEDEALWELERPSYTQDAACRQPNCGIPYPPPARGQFSAPNRRGHRWYTPERGDNLWNLSRTILVRRMAMFGTFREPSAQDIQTLSNTIRSHACNQHLRDVMFLPRFKRDRCTRGGAYYGSIYIPVVFD